MTAVYDVRVSTRARSSGPSSHRHHRLPELSLDLPASRYRLAETAVARNRKKPLPDITSAKTTKRNSGKVDLILWSLQQKYFQVVFDDFEASLQSK